MTPEEIEATKQASVSETESAAGAAFSMSLQLDIYGVMAIVGNLQLALRHPGNSGIPAQVARATVTGLIEVLRQAGFPKTADLLCQCTSPQLKTPEQPTAQPPSRHKPWNQ